MFERNEELDFVASNASGGKGRRKRMGSAKNSPLVSFNGGVGEVLEPCFNICDSRIHEKGLFAIRPIRQNEQILRYLGERIGKCVSDKREREYIDYGIRSIYMFAIDEDHIIDATKKGNDARYMNHSCNPNVFSEIDTNHSAIYYYASRDIGIGEELTTNYKVSCGEDSLECNCGSEGCLKVFG